MHFEPAFLDWNQNPVTGCTRKTWLQAGKYLLQGIFQDVHSMEDALVIHRTECKITYPHKNAPEKQLLREKKAEHFEAVARSFLLAAVLLENDPDLAVNGIPVGAYYRKQILGCVDPDSPDYVGSFADMLALTGSKRTDIPAQQTVETGALVIGLWLSRRQIWERFTRAEKDKVAAFLSDWGHHATCPQNWRLFNMLDLAFLSMEGYPIDERVMEEHALRIADCYAGDGWYRDGHSFDYYSAWGFGLYLPIWCRWYGYRHMEQTAVLFEHRHNGMIRKYPAFFDRDGHTTMWGRSGIYRMAAVSPLISDFLLDHPEMDPGTARCIASGSLLQFLSREDFLSGGVPSLGFYGPFAPLVQGYSCAASPLWLAKPFLCLHYPAEHPFWQAVEKRGVWEDLKEGKETYLPGPGLCITNHPANGETIFRTAKVLRRPDDQNGLWCYGKLSYNSKYPWEASVPEELEPEQYVLSYEDPDRGWQHERPNAIFAAGERSGVLYRRAFFHFDLTTEMHWMDAADLADIAVPYGILRCDRLRPVHRPMIVSLASYGFPDADARVEVRCRENARAVIVTGTDPMGNPRTMAMTIWSGFRSIGIQKSRGTSPESPDSLVIAAKGSFRHLYDADEPSVFLSQVLTRNDGKGFLDADLFPIRRITWACGAGNRDICPITLELADRSVTIDFSEMEGRLSL